MKTAWTTQGKWLRSTIGCACILHILFFVFSLAFVGFPSMIINLILASWSYSVYLTLNEWKVLLYFLFLAAATLSGLIYGIEQKKDGVQKMGLIVNCCFYCANIYFIGTAYWSFRKTGGIKGLKPTTDLPEERAARKVNNAMNRGANYVEKKIDERGQDSD